MNGWAREWIWLLVCFIGAVWQPVQAQSVVRYYVTDALGSVAVATDEAGNVTERREYEPYGAQLTPAIQDGPGYTGHVQDAATGLIYMQQRYYDPGVGVFLSVDAVSVDSSSGWNFCRYCYAANNPYRFTDPDGRIIRATTPGQEAFIAEQINSLALGTFAFDGEGRLQLLDSGGDQSGYSSKYQERLIDAINSEKAVGITVSPTYITETGREVDVDSPLTGGGLTDGSLGGDQHVIISGRSNNTIKGVDGSSIPRGPGMVLMHELVGHAIPNMIGGGSGNAVENENEVRRQIPGAGQREAQSWHDEKF